MDCITMKQLEHESIAQACAAHEVAAKALQAEIAAKYPIGSRISCYLGKDIPVTIEVTGHSWSWWHEPAMIHGVNVKTGKVRKVSATYEPANIVTLSTP
jgi:hypothetical protein